jgi:small subunit ribosomal protein S18|tara:strand:- start:2303 stop:2575 length:273 start_codon:yes stop_codon:yes gene_type:complete
MKRNKRKDSKKRKSNSSKLSLFQKPGIKFFKPCPLSGKDAPVVDYKNIKLLRKYLSETGRILPSRITSVSLKKQKELSRAVKRARLLALL